MDRNTNQTTTKWVLLYLMMILAVGCNNIATNEASFNSLSTTEAFVQNNMPTLDVLFIVDNSPGLQEEQEAIGNNFQTFLDTLGNIDWQVAITTTDVSGHVLYGLDGRFLSFNGIETPGNRILTKNTPNYQTAFYNTIVRPETIHPAEGYTAASFLVKPFEAFLGAIEKRNSDNKGFFRDQSDVAMIMITNTDSSQIGNRVYPKDVLEEFHRVFGDAKKLRSYGIIIKEGDETCLSRQHDQSAGDEAYGKYVTQLTKMTSGIVGDICSSDYSEVIASIGNDTRNFVQSFTLAHRPVANSVEVAFDPPNNGVPWQLDGQQVVFLKDLPPSTKVSVSYRY